ncbi:hypothetical protein TNIN_482181 [Trichonephila inaurata madagascariensis]|uniref:Uncharacterized protein n=1 Tax=Trichonephila inaurata madagascariensis TaxID=2747483 RepID=A0A8X6XKY9_9ARAC|nr:hypothetical protein TNIN_482181 [Trichonephila inaurata madagascariensis]
MANWSHCEKFPQLKKKKDEALLNRHSNILNIPDKISKTVSSNLSYANALLGNQNKTQLTGPSVPAEKPHHQNSDKNNEKPFGFTDAIVEIKKFFLDYSFLLEMGKQFRNANGDELTSSIDTSSKTCKFLT